MTQRSGRSTLAMALAILLLANTRVGLASPQAKSLSEPGTATIRGTLVDHSERPLAGYKVKVLSDSGSAYESATTGPDGSFDIINLPRGTYTYEIIDPAGKVVTVRIPPVTIEAGTVLTQPIAIVPRKGKKGPLIAWLAGGGAVVIAALAAAGGKNNGSNPSMTAATTSAPR